MGMFADDRVKAIICVRGGYGSARLLCLLDFSFIRRHPKIFIGFSDITALHCALQTRSRLVTFHGPTLNTDITNDDPSAFSIQSLLKTVMQPSVPGSICVGAQKNVSILKGGKGYLLFSMLIFFIKLTNTAKAKANVLNFYCAMRFNGAYANCPVLTTGKSIAVLATLLK